MCVLLLSLCVCSRESLVECLEKALDRLDVLVTSGGVSMGEKVCVCMKNHVYSILAKYKRRRERTQSHPPMYSLFSQDLLKPVLEEHFKATIHFGRVLMKPG